VADEVDAVRSAGGVCPPGGGLVGYIVDLACAKRGKGMWTNAQCVERCVRDGDNCAGDRRW
jgi:hypothetical protein